MVTTVPGVSRIGGTVWPFSTFGRDLLSLRTEPVCGLLAVDLYAVRPHARLQAFLESARASMRVEFDDAVEDEDFAFAAE